MAPEFEREGFVVLGPLLDPAEVAALCAMADPLLVSKAGARPGVRRVFEREPRMIGVLRGTRVAGVVRSAGGPAARVVRTILFDKSPGSNWAVPWHQDAVVALRERHEVDGFGPWSVKDGEPHARPPREVLDRIGVLRIGLDVCGPGNGPVRVIPGSHRWGVLGAEALEAAVAAGPVVECCTQEGGALLMRPHLIHASSRSDEAARRRVLHIEFTSAELPAPLEWAEDVVL